MVGNEPLHCSEYGSRPGQVALAPVVKAKHKFCLSAGRMMQIKKKSTPLMMKRCGNILRGDRDDKE
jgi:hypothetical protein